MPGDNAFIPYHSTTSLPLPSGKVRRIHTPGGLALKPTLYLFTQDGCANCPAAKAVVNEAFEGSDVQVRTMDLREMDSDLEYILLEHQIFVASTPAIIVENNGSMKLLYSGKIPDVETIRREVREFR
ncbi:MAG: hypothetical protein C4K48_09660 [Candidatus Thorarchaeota archaeon]|nr:MAG: hypothetical protein C4K48_09660 [Candidatus Thorarchaeota archaeon]